MSFTNLPTELVVQICEHLGLADWCALRLTCKTLFLRSVEAFADSSFHTIWVLVTSESLGRLAAVARDANLRTRVKDICIVPILFEETLKEESSRPRNLCKAPGSSSVYTAIYGQGFRTGAELYSRSTAYQAIVADHRRILNTGTFAKTFSESLACFENLASVGLRSCPTWVLLDPTRPMKFPCLGVRRLRNQLPCVTKIASSRFPGPVKELTGDTHARALAAVVDGIVTAKTELRRLETCDSRHCGVSAEDLITLTTTKPSYKHFLILLRNLETLHLCLFNADKVAASEGNDHRLQDALEMVETAAPSLQTLTFSLSCAPFKRLSPHTFSLLSQRVNFTRLVELELRDLDFTRDGLQAFLRSATTTLQRLILFKVSLVDTITPASSWDYRAPYADRRQWHEDYKAEIGLRWRAVWEDLRHDLLSLRYLRMDTVLFCGHMIEFNHPPRNINIEKTLRSRPIYTVTFQADHAHNTLGEWISDLKPTPSDTVFGFIRSGRPAEVPSTPYFRRDPIP
ncbi:hypothetical protein ASPACDRAFT_47331 [Aspergillus aculeatus ATCC 16872]|uniref:F-box domain-containing protein n=1 Tax=Aspergillus aculeatus (strain ATCC 16872 / CBS 172.66 / WB 5094) TaxID=690307 RepID=A0A1L9WIF8_ASPA1|nr:uncharacterized protein ASPACDRAFT_47331 [Aspergillus aculeatus ATCC 16872]OJJ95974.1 hypothetical protein ASPACDRAFT_47331 [Aspergillus aculeatus ATCC 16872]